MGKVTDLGVAVTGRRRRAARIGAAVAAVAMHGLLFLLLIPSATGALLSGSNGGGEARDAEVVPIALAGAPGEERGAPKPEDEIQKLLTQLRTDSSLVIVERPKAVPKLSTRLDDLFAELDKAHARQFETGSGSHANNDRGGKGVSVGGKASADQSPKSAQPKAKLVAARGGTALSGTLWEQIKPCWSKLPDGAAVPVTLEIALGPDGRISTPPKIIRPSAEAPTQQRLISEARALEAVRACMPYRGVAMGPSGGEFKVEFVTSK